MSKKILSIVITFIVLIILGLSVYLISKYFIKEKTISKFNPFNKAKKKNAKPIKKTFIVPKTAKQKTPNLKIKKKSKIKVTNPDEILINSKKPEKIEIFSPYFLQKTFENLKITNWKEAVVLNYEKEKKDNLFDNNFKIKNASFQNDIFQKLLLEAIAKKLDFEDLLITFEYFDDFTKIKVTIAFHQKPNIFINKYYQIKT